jgi:hypothetical protein
LIWVRMAIPPRAQIATALSPVFPLRGKVSMDGEQILWSVAEDLTAVGSLVSGGGLVLIDLACDYLFDVDGRPVSGSAHALHGVEPVVPGGILRVWITVRAG